MAMDECKEGVLAASQLKPCVNNMQNTHSFMLMTINRCIDYTKASKGLKLRPTYETIDLMETLSLPVNCMRNMQKKIEIVVNAWSNKVCPFLITDKQWLQENALCLLSNAVKYSVEGHVSINISLEEYYSRGWKMNILEHVQDFGDKLSDNSEDDAHSCRRKYPPLIPFVRIEVEDTGIGMSEEAMASLFNPSKQTQRLAGGTGLGLYSLAKRLEALHGFYGVMKRRDGQSGSLFWFAIPYKLDAIYAQRAIASTCFENDYNRYGCPSKDVGIEKSELTSSGVFQTLPSVDTSTSISTETTLLQTNTVTTISKEASSLVVTETSLQILVVDDSYAILKMCTMMLKRCGYNVVTAENGAIAVNLIQEKLAKNEQFDVILMDLQMPVMDGLEATQRIRQIETFADFPHPSKHIVIGMSANSDADTAASAYAVGVDAFLPKPFRIETFRSTLNRFM
jgi:CheY-like chemotaxis protein